MPSDNGRRFTTQIKRMGKRISEVLPRAALRGGTIIETGAKQKIVEKGHVVTGTLLRSVNTQLGEVTPNLAEALTGTAVLYGKYVEALDDGGFLFESSEENTAKAVRAAADTIEQAMEESA